MFSSAMMSGKRYLCIYIYSYIMYPNKSLMWLVTAEIIIFERDFSDFKIDSVHQLTIVC